MTRGGAVFTGVTAATVVVSMGNCSHCTPRIATAATVAATANPATGLSQRGVRVRATAACLDSAAIAALTRVTKLRDPARVTEMGYPYDDELEAARRRRRENGTNPPTNCTTCHR